MLVECLFKVSTVNSRITGTRLAAFSAEFIQNLEKKNPKLTYVSGKEWLLYQAIGAYASFLDEEANIEAMRKVL